ncbi:hypothetical protein D3C78_1198110 [compost metagenome]
MVLRVDRRLHVVADHSGAPRFHRTGIGIGQGDLFIRCFVELNLDFLELLHLGFQGRDLVVEAFGFDLSNGRFLTICGIERRQITIDAGLNLRHSPLKLGAGEVAVAIVDRLELAAVDGHQRFGEQTKLLAQHHELPTDAADCLAVILAEVGDGFEVRHQAPGQPHQLDVALRFALEASTGLDPIEVAVDVNLQQDAGMVSGPAGFRRDDTLETQPAEVEFIDEHIDHPHRVGVRHVIIQALGQQRALTSTLSLDETLHGQPPL